jgi:hypothetical protein
LDYEKEVQFDLIVIISKIKKVFTQTNNQSLQLTESLELVVSGVFITSIRGRFITDDSMKSLRDSLNLVSF